MTDSPSRGINDLQVMAFRLGITPEEMIRIAEATSWEAVERAVARRSLRRGDYVKIAGENGFWRVKMAGRSASTIQIEEVGGFRTVWAVAQDATLVGSPE